MTKPMFPNTQLFVPLPSGIKPPKKDHIMGLKRYRVAVPEVWIHYYDVDAYSKEDALLIAAEEGDDVEELAEYSRTLENDDLASVEELTIPQGLAHLFPPRKD